MRPSIAEHGGALLEGGLISQAGREDIHRGGQEYGGVRRFDDLETAPDLLDIHLRRRKGLGPEHRLSLRAGSLKASKSTERAGGSGKQ
jgi:hypothetical protein